MAWGSQVIAAWLHSLQEGHPWASCGLGGSPSRVWLLMKTPFVVEVEAGGGAPVIRASGTHGLGLACLWLAEAK